MFKPERCEGYHSAPPVALGYLTPFDSAWLHRMTWPRDEGEFEPWRALEATLLPFLERQAGARFLPWSAANARAIEDGAEEFTVEIDGNAWTQKPQKYHARSLRVLKERYAAADKTDLDAVLEKAGCLGALAD